MMMLSLYNCVAELYVVVGVISCSDTFTFMYFIIKLFMCRSLLAIFQKWKLGLWSVFLMTLSPLCSTQKVLSILNETQILMKNPRVIHFVRVDHIIYIISDIDVPVNISVSVRRHR